MSVFSQKTYKRAIEHLLARLRESETEAGKWTNSALADACGIQKTYLSRVLNGDAHLNSDQLFLACKYLKASKEEADYVSLVHERDRSEVRERRLRLEEDIERLRSKAIDTRDYISPVKVEQDSSGVEAYYFDPMIQLVHLFLTINKFADNPGLLCTKLSIDQSALSYYLNVLRGLGLVETKAGRTRVVKDSLHLSADSPLIRPYQILTRLKGLEKLQRSSAKDQYAYSLIFSADDDVRAEILTKFMQFLKQAESLIRPAKCSRVYQLHFDLLDWGGG